MLSFNRRTLVIIARPLKFVGDDEQARRFSFPISLSSPVLDVNSPLTSPATAN